jgi:hypothetical protein
MWVSIALADATSAGQGLCASAAEAERATAVVALNAVESRVLIFVLPSFTRCG